MEKPQKTIDKLEVIMSDGLVRAKIEHKGKLKLTDYYGEEIGEYILVEDGILKNVKSEEIIELSGEKRPCLYIKNNAFRKVVWYENPIVSMGLAIASILIMIVNFISVVYQMNKRKKQNIEKQGNATLVRNVQVIQLGTTMLTLLFIVLIAGVTMKLGKYAFMFGIPNGLKIILCIPWILCGIEVALVILNIRMWRKSCGRLRDRVEVTIYTLGLIMLLMALKFWNMIIWV